ncbi:DUF1366 domain-containing protein [Streptococcus pluranimalium]
MKLEFSSKQLTYDLSGNPSATQVILSNSDGANVPVFLLAKDIDLSNSELLEKALEVIYEENFPNRAENEKFNLIGQKIAEIDNAIERSDKQYERVEELLKVTTTTVNELIMSLMSEEEEAVTDEPETEVN